MKIMSREFVEVDMYMSNMYKLMSDDLDVLCLSTLRLL
jgi:hypothetical protein